MAEFFHMGGYALYVWSSLGIACVVLLLNVLLPMQRHREVLRKAADFHELENTPHPQPFPHKGGREQEEIAP